MAEEKGFENGRNSNFQGLVTLTLTLDPAIRHTVVHHSSTSTYIPNFIEIKETFCGRTDGRTDVRTDICSPSNIIRSTFGSRPKNVIIYKSTILNYCIVSISIFMIFCLPRSFALVVQSIYSVYTIYLINIMQIIHCNT